jgi:hypothetical protein
MGNGVFSFGVQAAGKRLCPTHLHLVPSSRMRGAIPPLLHISTLRGAYLRIRENFTCTLWYIKGVGSANVSRNTRAKVRVVPLFYSGNAEYYLKMHKKQLGEVFITLLFLYSMWELQFIQLTRNKALAHNFLQCRTFSAPEISLKVSTAAIF